MLSGLFRLVEGLKDVLIPELDGLAPGAHSRVVEFEDLDEHFHYDLFELLEKKTIIIRFTFY